MRVWLLASSFMILCWKYHCFSKSILRNGFWNGKASTGSELIYMFSTPGSFFYLLNYIISSSFTFPVCGRDVVAVLPETVWLWRSNDRIHRSMQIIQLYKCYFNLFYLLSLGLTQSKWNILIFNEWLF